MKYPKAEIYEDLRGEWRWRLKAKNSRVIADSGEGYKRRSGAIRAWQATQQIVRGTCVMEVL